MTPGSDSERKDATATTAAINERARQGMPADDSDFERATRGRLAAPSSDQIMGSLGVVWDLEAFDFIDDPALSEVPPSTVSPSLWRQAQLNNLAGLFRVSDRIFQVRGFDLSNISFIAASTGWIIIDPLTAAETAAAALALANETLGERPVIAVIYTHSHIDHYGGVHGVVDEADVRSGAVEIIAPEGFLEAAVSENVLAGTVMTRRGTYMYGALLPKDAKGLVDNGLGKTVPLFGTTGLLAPTTEIRATGEELTIDGVRMIFQVTPDTEAPAEMNFFFPDDKVLCMAENCTANMHNIYTLRGAKIRDSLGWSKQINESIELFGADTDILFASHHWPRFGREDAVAYLASQRDAYRYLHDQTLRLANHGLSMNEIAEELTLPASLGDEYFNRGYYGTVSHNAKAVYQRYLGWFDANPAHLNPHPPVEAATRYVEFMGGAEALLRQAAVSFEAGDYRWVAEVVNHLVFADPTNEPARLLQADALEQLGYQAESGPWRNFYLSGAQELRMNGTFLSGANPLGKDSVRAMTTEMLLDLMGVRLNGPAAADIELRLDLEVDAEEHWAVGVSRGAIHASSGRHHVAADVRIIASHDALAALVSGAATLDALLDAGSLSLDGDESALRSVLERLDSFTMGFEIVLP